MKTTLAPPKAKTKRLADLRNVGPAMLADFKVLEIETIAQLAKRDPHVLYLELQKRTRQKHDPCVWDVFAAAIHEARTGEALDWWAFTPKRKALQAQRQTMPSH